MRQKSIFADYWKWMRVCCVLCVVVECWVEKGMEGNRYYNKNYNNNILRVALLCDRLLLACRGARGCPHSLLAHCDPGRACRPTDATCPLRGPSPGAHIKGQARSWPLRAPNSSTGPRTGAACRVRGPSSCTHPCRPNRANAPTWPARPSRAAPRWSTSRVEWGPSWKQKRKENNIQNSISIFMISSFHVFLLDSKWGQETGRLAIGNWEDTRKCPQQARSSSLRNSLRAQCNAARRLVSSFPSCCSLSPENHK